MEKGVLFSLLNLILNMPLIIISEIFLFKKELSFRYQMKFINHMPLMLHESENDIMGRLVTIEELNSVLHACAKEKSPGPDGWGVELYIHFFDLMSQDVLNAVEEYQIKGCVSGAINANFIALIPKKKCPESFFDFHPISFCNFVYKLISKLIAARFKSLLTDHISLEQFGFIERRQIQDAVAIAHKVLYSIKVMIHNAFLTKVDITKAFDNVEWEFLRLIL